MEPVLDIRLFSCVGAMLWTLCLGETSKKVLKELLVFRIYAIISMFYGFECIS